MTRNLCLATLLVTLASTTLASAKDRQVARLDANGNLDTLVAKHAAANNLPEELVRRVIKRESGGNARVVSRGNYGLMQIKLGTARALGYQGDAAGLLDPDTNMTYAVKYLAGAYQAAGGNSGRAVHYYAAGYYHVAKRKSLSVRADAATVDGVKTGPRGEIEAGAEAAVEPEMEAVAPFADANGGSVSSASSLYTGRIDYH